MDGGAMPTSARGGNPRIADHARAGVEHREVRCPRCERAFGNLPEHLRAGCDGG